MKLRNIVVIFLILVGMSVLLFQVKQRLPKSSQLFFNSSIIIENSKRNIEVVIQSGYGCVLKIPIKNLDGEKSFAKYNTGVIYIYLAENIVLGSCSRPAQIVWSDGLPKRRLAVDPNDCQNLTVTLIKSNKSELLVEVSGCVQLKSWYPVEFLTTFETPSSSDYIFDELYGIKIVWTGKNHQLSFNKTLSIPFTGVYTRGQMNPRANQ